jgi:hypothetical protein
MKLILLLASLITAATWPNPALDDRVKTGEVQFAYVEPTDPADRDLYNRLQAMHVLERLSEFLSPLRLPRTLTLKVQNCGTVNSYYWNDTVFVCYEYFDFLMNAAPKVTTMDGLTRHEALAGMTADVFLHETGHAIFDMLGVPFLGREEDAADQVSAYTQLQMAKDDARRLILAVAYLGNEQVQQEMAKPLNATAFADVHELPAQRYFNVLCMAYGADPVLFADAISQWHLPEKRAKNCSYEYRRFAYGFQTLIGPYIDMPLVEQVRAKKLLAFPDPNVVVAHN